jgi:enediyne polyketide synthase
MNDDCGIAVVGIACRYPGASTPQQLWENILARRRQFRRIPDCRLSLADYHDPDRGAADKTYGAKAAVLDGFEFDWVRWRIPKTTFESTDIVHWLALEVAQRALEDAGYSKETVPTERTGAILGNTLTGEQTRAQSMRLRWPFVRRALLESAHARGMFAAQASKLAEAMEPIYKSAFAPVTEDSLAGGLSNTIAGRICNYFDLHGGGYTVDGACASSLIAVATAARALAQGELDLALAGGVDVSLDTFELIGFAKTGALTAADMRVYDRRASGFAPGEGCGFAVLKRLKDARADGNYVYAVLTGWGLSSDGRGGITAPSGKGQAKALGRAFERASGEAKLLDFVEGHGTGTPVGDREELIGLALSLGDRGAPPLRPCGVTSVKSVIGHTKAAAGIAGFLKAVMAVNQRILPPTAGCAEPNPVFEAEARLLYPILQGEIRSPACALRAGVSAMGFGGINSHVTLESADPPAAHLKPACAASLDERALMASAQETELFVLAGSTVPDLVRRTRDLSRMAAGMSEAEMVDLASRLAAEIEPNAPLRAAIVASSPAALSEALEELREKLLRRVPPVGEVVELRRDSLWLGNGCESPRLGFLFPGQGSQKLNMARRLVEQHPWARELVADADQALKAQGLLGFSSESLAELVYRPSDRAIDAEQVRQWASSLTRTEIAQPAICLASVLWLRRLERLGIRPAVVGGHSLGELAAFHAAGAFDALALICLAGLRGEAMSAPREGAGTMASLGCSAEEARALLDPAAGHAVVANVNSPGQTVISGEEGAVASAIALAVARDIPAQRLPVSNAFHSKLIAAAAERLRAQAQLPPALGPLSARLMSSIDGRVIRPGIDLREHFAEQLLAPVDFISLVHAMAAQCDAMVEVGPGAVLTGLVRATLGDAKGCFPLESKPEADADLNAFLASFFARGGDVNWNELYAGRLVRPFVPAEEMIFIENPCERPLRARASREAMPQGPAEGSAGVDRGAALLAEGLGVPADQLAAYLSRRGSFLGAVVRADLESLPRLAPRAPEDRDGDHALPEASRPPDAGAECSKVSAADLLLDLVADRSGFPRETLTLTHRLLDDLNMDSIKAAELVAQAAKALGISGPIDPAPLANASLQKIAQQLELLAASGSKPQRGPDAAGLGSARLSRARERWRPTWVRDFALEPVPEALPARTPAEVAALTGPALILSEEGERDFALALSEDLRRRGLEAIAAPYGREARGDRFTAVIAILPREPAAALPLTERLPSAVERLRATVRHGSSSRGASGAASLAYVQFGGGFFGKGPSPADVEQCCATALAASLWLERPELRVRVLDFVPGVSAADCAERLCAELAGPEGFSAVGYDGQGTRRVRKPRLLEPADYASRRHSWSSEDVVLVTGGAKGITAECALALARETGVRLALVGSSALEGEAPSDERGSEVRRTLERAREAGVTARYYPCDVADPRAVELLVQRVRDDLGRIAAVIHGAGLNRPAALEKVSTNDALAEIAPKVLGVANLCRALESEPPRLIVGLSSIIGITGMARNGWYGFANEALSVALASFGERHPETATLSLAFSVWDEIGMGARMGSVAHLSAMGIDSIPVAEGVRRFVRLFTSDPGVREVVTTARMGSLATWSSPPFQRPESARFLETIASYVPGVELVARTRLTLEKDPYLKDHVWRGTHLFPAVFGLEAMAQAVASVAGESGFESVRIEGVRLERPVAVDPRGGAGIEIRAEVLEGEGPVAGRRVRAEIAAEQTGFDKAHFSAEFVLSRLPEAPTMALDMAAEPLDIDPKRDLYGWLLFQGESFQRIEKIHSLDSRGTLLISRRSRRQAGDGSALEGSFLLGDPFFRDSMLHSVQLPLTQDLCLPAALDSIERFDATNECSDTVAILTTIDAKKDREVEATITAVAGGGRVLERIKARMHILEHRSGNPTPEDLAAPRPRDEANLREDRARRGGMASEVLAPEHELQPMPLRAAAERRVPDLDHDLTSHGATLQRTPSGRVVLAVRSPVTFREAANSSRTVHFSHYFSWLGKLREFIVAPVFEPLVERFSTGEWGMVTNSAQVEICGEARTGDVIEGRVWVEDVSGPASSTVEMGFEWRKALPGGGLPLIATGKMSSTWVAVQGPGVVEVRPFPEFARCFLEKLLLRRGDSGAEQGRHSTPRRAELGRELYRAPPGPVSAASLLREQVFETSLEDANLVGNLYFANYYAWQGRLRDRFFHELARKAGGAAAVKGEPRCTFCKVEHLQEAMPFEEVQVKMHLRAVHERGVRLAFDYFGLGPEGHRRKLGHGEHEVAWFEPISGGEWVPSALPSALRASLVPEAAKRPTRTGAREDRHGVVVVGAGVGGLAAGALLAQRGRRVVVVEQHDQPGGFCTSWQRVIGSGRGGDPRLRFVFDAGVQDVLGVSPGGNVHRLLEELGVAKSIEWRRVSHEYIQAGLQLKVPRSLAAFREELAARFPSERAGLAALFAEIDACNRAIYRPAGAQANGSSALARWSDTPFAAMVKTYVRDERLLHLVSILSHYICDDPKAVSALSMCPVFAYYSQGGFYPLGGSQGFSDALASALEMHGGELRLRTRVARILVEQGRARGVQLADGSAIEADRVVVNADVQRTFLELVGREHLDPRFARRIEGLRTSCSAFLVLLGLDIVPEVEPLTVVLAEDGAATLVGTLSKIDPSLATPGYSRVQLSALIPSAEAKSWERGAPGYANRKRQFGDALIQTAERAIPELRKHIVFREEASPATFARYTGATHGAVYGLDIEEWRPSIQAPIRNLFLVGAGVAPRPGLEDAVRSALKVADAVCRSEEERSAGESLELSSGA